MPPDDGKSGVCPGRKGTGYGSGQPLGAGSCRISSGGAEPLSEGDKTCFGEHTVTYLEAPMVHWPEAMVTLDLTNGALFSADAFGSFKALDGRLFNDEVNYDRDWIDSNRRYLTNIVGKYGPHIRKLLNKAAPVLDQIKFICPLHGLVWRNNLDYLLDKYNHWASYEPEEKV